MQIPAYQELTPRERDIVKLVTHGASNKQIARVLSVSEGTIKAHLHHIFEKVAISNRTLLAVAMLAYGDYPINSLRCDVRAIREFINNLEKQKEEQK